MEGKKSKKKELIQLFLRKIKLEELPEPKWRPARKDQPQIGKIRESLGKLDHELEEIEAPIYKKIYESIGMSVEEIKAIFKQGSEKFQNFRDSFKKEYHEYMFTGNTSILSPTEATLADLLCKDVTINVCKRKVCVNQPVPLTVDEIQATHGSDGTFDLIRANDRFKYEDDICGYGTWNLNYHRHSRIHEGGISIRSSAELVEAATIRQIGVRFEPLLDYRGWPLPNGVFAEGGYRPNRFCPRSRGRGYMWIAFKVRSKLPGGSWTTRVDSYHSYKNTGWINNNIMQTHTYPPWKYLHLNTQFPAGTQFLIEAVLSYEIEGNGAYNGCAFADYNLEVQPYMNLEACSWEWPNWVVVHLDDEGNP